MGGRGGEESRRRGGRHLPSLFMPLPAQSRLEDKGSRARATPTPGGPSVAPSPANKMCSGPMTLTAVSGVITDGASGAYQNNMECTWLIRSPNRTRPVTLNFQSFNLETNYDFLYIYDGDSASAIQIERLSGSSLPSVLRASSGAMFIRFTTDSSVTKNGFSATYTSGTRFCRLRHLFSTRLCRDICTPHRTTQWSRNHRHHRAAATQVS